MKENDGGNRKFWNGIEEKLKIRGGECLI